jgi:hypothetical protein
MSTVQEFDYTSDLDAALLWQYNNATNLQALVNNQQAWFDTNHTDFWQEWQDSIFNLYGPNFNDFGAAVWAIILNIPLQSSAPADEAGKPIFLFDATVGNGENFDNGVFSYGGNPFTFTLAEKVLILKLRYFQLHNRGAVTQINEFLATLFEGFEGYDGTVYIQDHLNMTITYILTRPVSSFISYIITQPQFDLFPRPAAVELTGFVVDPGSYFQFDATVGNGQNFDNGPFFRFFGQ